MKSRKSPCSECPWRRTAGPGWLGSEQTPEDWAQTAHRDDTVECHTDAPKLCAGIAIYRTNVGKRLRKLKSAGVQPQDAKLDDLRDWAAMFYIQAFEAVVEAATDGWTSVFDKWGARAYKDQHGRQVFAGDGAWELPWYETAALLKERIQDHLNEMAAT